MQHSKLKWRKGKYTISNRTANITIDIWAAGSIPSYYEFVRLCFRRPTSYELPHALLNNWFFPASGRASYINPKKTETSNRKTRLEHTATALVFQTFNAGVDLFESNYSYYYRVSGQCIQRRCFTNKNNQTLSESNGIREERIRGENGIEHTPSISDWKMLIRCLYSVWNSKRNGQLKRNSRALFDARKLCVLFVERTWKSAWIQLELMLDNLRCFRVRPLVLNFA